MMEKKHPLRQRTPTDPSQQLPKLTAPQYHAEHPLEPLLQLLPPQQELPTSGQQPLLFQQNGWELVDALLLSRELVPRLQ
jgi:hypothetical protein